jgi:hypothetical protein
MLQEAGLYSPPAPPSQPPSPDSILFWKKIPGWVYLCVVALSVVITLVSGYPLFSCNGGERLDPSDPYSEMFTLTNEGYVPVTDPQVDCLYMMKIVKFGQSTIISIPFRIQLESTGSIGHGGKITAPCFAKVNGLDPVPGSKLDVTVSYAFWHLNLHWLRRSQTFHFLSVGGSNNSLHWQFL